MSKKELFVNRINARDARSIVVAEHYLHRAPSISFAFELADKDFMGEIFGIITFGSPASHHLMRSVCPDDPSIVIELNRLWVNDSMPRNTESWFIAKALKMMPPRIVVSYADTAAGHVGYVYRASNFLYAGMTDMDRKIPRFDYVTKDKHSRDTSRNGTMATAERVRRNPKHRYWIVTGDKRDRRDLKRLCAWPVMDWRSRKIQDNEFGANSE